VQLLYPDEPSLSWQSDSYQTARVNFLRACEKAGVEVASYAHPLKTPDGADLATDVARFGASDASKLLVMVSGVHGVEGFSGAATQVGWIEQKRYEQLPDDTAVLMVHLINPWGAAHLRRYTENNVDLCRNFLDFSQALPANEAYGALHGQLAPGGVLGEYGENTRPFLGKLVSEKGLEYVVDLFMGGQWEFEQGFAFGGQGPEWSNVTLRDILRLNAEGVRQACVIEFHTGLGPWGYGQLITMHHGPELDRVRRDFGPWVFNPSADKSPGEEGYRLVHGHTIEAYRSSFPGVPVTAVTLEFGTYPPDETLALLLQEHLLVCRSESAPAHKMDEIRTGLLEYHHPRDWEWRCAFWSRSLQVIRQALGHLKQEDCHHEG
jgi:hypothetical protein